MIGNIKNALRRIAVSEVLRPVARSIKSGPTVLFYHGVETEISDPRVQTLHTPVSQFEEQIEFLRRNFEVISIEDLCSSLGNASQLDPRQVVLTFDDGYKNNLEVVAPMLNSVGFPFAVFVSTNHIDRAMRFPTYYLRVAVYYSRENSLTVLGRSYDISGEAEKREAIKTLSRIVKYSDGPTSTRALDDIRAALPSGDWREIDERFSSDAPMSWPEVADLHGLGATIGSHCHDHMLLHDQQSRGFVEAQIVRSLELIEKHVAPCRTIAYPNGTVSDMCSDVPAIARKAGLIAGFTTIRGDITRSAHPLLLPRVSAESLTMEDFKYRVSWSSRHNAHYRAWLESRSDA